MEALVYLAFKYSYETKMMTQNNHGFIMSL